MKVLSLIQPWASLVIMGAKRYEVRRWQTRYRGPLLIHASARKPSRREQQIFTTSDYYRDYLDDLNLLPYGCLIGQVQLEEIYPTAWLIQHFDLDKETYWARELAFDDFSPSRFAWKLAAPTAFKYSIPVKGSLGLWEYKGLLD